MSLSLRGSASVYQSYRRGRIILSRFRHNVAFDTYFTWPDLRLKYLLDHAAPRLFWPACDKFMVKSMIEAAAESDVTEPGASRREKRKRTERRMREDWHLLPCASMNITNPVVQEDFIPALRRGEIIPVQGFRDFAGEKEVELTDGRVLEVDAVIFCTGYSLDFSIMPELEMNGTCGIPVRTAEEISAAKFRTPRQENEHVQEPDIPRLYQMIFPPRRASSIAFLSWITPQESRWGVFELASMAIAQIWAAEMAQSQELGPVSYIRRPPALLPHLDEMNAQVNAYQTWFRRQWEKDHSIAEGFVQGHTFYRFLHNAAGTGLYGNLDHALSGRGWRLYLEDRKLWTWLAKGPISSYSWRLFDTNPEGIPGCGRGAWLGARKALEDSVSLYNLGSNLIWLQNTNMI